MKKKNSKKNHTTKETHLHLATFKGILEVKNSGIGYVLMTDGLGDILVRQDNFNTAFNGDTVRVKVIKENIKSGKREGKITEIVTRKQTEFIGTVQLSKAFAFFIPDSLNPIPDFFIPKENINNANDKDKVLVRLLKWDKGDKKPVGEIISVLTKADENDAAMKEIIIAAGFNLTFSDEVLTETQKLPVSLSEKEIKQRKDFRDVLTFTIDPVDAKDFDDAISIKKINEELFEIGVHIADVSYYVTPETALDDEAYKRATSVYLPDRVNPMLPEKISNELCSLRPHEDKFTFSAVFEMTISGKIKNYWLGKTVIHSNHRFTYEDVQQIIEGGTGKHDSEILLLNTIAQTIRKNRFEKGAINFSSQEVRFKLDENGKPISIIVKESKASHQLIEEFMLLANKTVAEHIDKASNKNPIPFPYRVHDKPNEEKLIPFIEFARKFGHQFNISTPEKIAESFNQLLAEANGKPEQQVLEQLGIRTMAKALYTTKNIGHYGLAFPHYCHFTSPIRRYPDVLVHRILYSFLQGTTIIDKKLETKCKHCSEREKAAMDCERSGNSYKQVEFLKDHLGENFEGIISGVASFGFWVETIEHKCEGMVSIASLSDFDDFRFVENDYCLVGSRSGKVFRIGDKVLIKVVAASLEKRKLDYEWLHSNSDTAKKVKSASSKKSRK